jgi:hypothetical protein
MTAKINAEGYGPDIDAICEFISGPVLAVADRFSNPVLVSSFIYWGHVEAAIAVVVACLPALWHFFKAWPWKPSIRALSSGFGTSMRIRASTRSRHSILIDEEEEPAGISTTNIRSAGLATATYSTGGNISELHTLNAIKVERAYSVERG